MLSRFTPFPPLDDDIGDRVPGVVNADEQQQKGGAGYDKHGIARQSDYGPQHADVGNQRQRGMEQPVLQDRLVIALAPRAPDDQDGVGGAESSRMALKCTTVGVPKASIVRFEPEISATSAMTTNIRPVSAPADEPTMT